MNNLKTEIDKTFLNYEEKENKTLTSFLTC